MLTLFTTCKEFQGLDDIYQRNALTSWAHIEPLPDVVVWGNEAGAHGMCEELGFRHRSGLNRVGGVPTLDWLFDKAQQESPNDYLAFMNADVMVLDGLMEATQRVIERFPDGFLMVCRRWDVSLDWDLDFEQDWKAQVRELIDDHGILHSKCSSDIFLWKKPAFPDLPPFCPGFPEWDNWLMWKATHVGWPMVDVTPVMTLVHPVHDCGEYDAKEVARYWTQHPLAQRNRGLGQPGGQYCFVHVRKAGYLWRMDDKDIYLVEDGD